MYQIRAFQGMTKWSWPSVKIIITTGVYLTRGPSGPDPGPSGPRGRPTGQGLRWFGLSLGCHASTRGGEARVGGGHFTRSIGHHLALNWPLQVGGGHIHANKYHLAVKVDTPHIFCSSPLVKVFSSSSAGEALSGVKSRVESSLEL
jgi:hypothetical protein